MLERFAFEAQHFDADDVAGGIEISGDAALLPNVDGFGDLGIFDVVDVAELMLEVDLDGRRQFHKNTECPTAGGKVTMTREHFGPEPTGTTGKAGAHASFTRRS